MGVRVALLAVGVLLHWRLEDEKAVRAVFLRGRKTERERERDFDL